MATEVESQELNKESKFTDGDSCLSNAVGDQPSWLQLSSEEKTENCDGSTSKANSGLPSNGGLSFNKEDTKSSTDSLTSGSIWGQKPNLQMDGGWSAGMGGVDWGVSGDPISNLMNKDANKNNYPWRSAAVPDSHGTTNALDLSLDFWKPAALGASNTWGEPNSSNWGMLDIKSEFNQEGLPDKKVGSEQDRTKGVWNLTEDRKLDPIGPVQRRSASLTELNVTFESSTLGGEGVKFSSTGKVGVDDERSQPDGAEVSQHNREELITKMINSNEGWGKKPVIQDTPWQMETVSVASVPDPLPPAAAEDSNAAGKDVFWGNVPKESSASGWSGNQPAATYSYEWAPDSDIGMWNGPPPPEYVNPNVWTGPPKETNPVYPGGQSGMGQFGSDKGPMQGGGLPWGERGLPVAVPGGDKLAKDFGKDAGMDRLRGTETWGQQGPRGAFDSNWSTESNTWGVPHPTGHQDNWGAKQVNNFSSSGFNSGSKSDQKIGTWGEGMTTETGLWNQPQPLPNMQNPIQQLMDLGFKREDALMLQHNMGLDKLLELIKLQKEGEQPKGRIIRGKSMIEMPGDHFNQLQVQGGRNNYQAGRGSVYQPMMPGGGLSSQMHMKGSSGQQSIGGWSNAYGRTSAMPMVSQQQQPMAQMNPQMLQNLLHLQSLLQPLLHQRSQVQQNRTLSQMQKNIQIEQLNVYIADLKQKIDQVQLPFGPPPPVAGALPVTPSDVQIGSDEARMMQLLNQLKLDRDFTSLPHPPLGPINELQMADGKALGGISNLSANQMAALIGSGPWANPDSSVFKDKSLMSDNMPDAWANLTHAGASMSKNMGWPVSGEFGSSKGARPPPPPGLGNCEKTDHLWNQHLVNRSTSWAPGEKLKTNLHGQQIGISSNWLMLKNIGSSTDPGLLQKICLTYGPLQNFYYNKMLGQVLACFINRDDVINALSSIPQNLHGLGALRLVAEPVGVEEIGRLIDGTWTPIPPSSSLFGAIPAGAKVNSLRGGATGWGMDGM